jgi:prefoldin subunit 5
MEAVIDMAKAHLQNVAIKIKELEGQKQMLQAEIDKLNAYLNEGVANVDTAVSKLNN